MINNPIKPWIVKSSKHVFQDRWINVRADHCMTDEGTVISPYYVLEYQDWVHLVLLNDEKEILVTRQYRHGIGKISTEIPCGCVENYDSSPAAAAKRELLEETGYIAEEFTPIGVFSPNPATHSNSVYCFLCSDISLHCKPANDPTEVIETKFVSIDRLMTMIDEGEFCQSMHISTIFLALRKIELLPLIK